MEAMGRREDQACRDLQDLQASLDQEDSQASTVTSDLLDQRVCQGSLVLLVPRETLGAREAMVSRGPGGCLVLPAMLEREVLGESGAKLGLRDPLVSQERREDVECQDLMGLWDPRDSLETRVCREFKDPRESLETWVDQEPLGCKAFEDHPAGGVQEVPQDPWASLGTMVKMERQGNQVFRVCLAGLDQWGHLETRELLETREQRVPQEFRDLREVGEMLARMETMADQDPPDQTDLQEIEELQAVLDREDSRECLVLQERMVQTDRTEHQVCRESWE